MNETQSDQCPYPGECVDMPESTRTHWHTVRGQSGEYHVAYDSASGAIIRDDRPWQLLLS